MDKEVVQPATIKKRIEKHKILVEFILPLSLHKGPVQLPTTTVELSQMFEKEPDTCIAPSAS